jgi:cellobiose phosphorylase
VTQYILGIQPDYSGLRIDPCIPSNWKNIRITRRFKKKNFDITIKNPGGVQKGVKKIVINGQEIEGNLIPFEQMNDDNEVLVEMGR